MLQKTDVIGHFVCTCCDSCKNIQDSCIYLTGISLTGYRIAALESHLFSNHRIDLIDCLLITLKQLKEACLCSCSSFGAKEFQCAHHIFQILQVHQEFLCPESCTFTNCCRLCRLEMCECKRWLLFVFICKFGQFCNYVHQFLLNQFQSLCHNDDICVITYIAGCCTKMNDTFGLWALHTICIHV